MLLRSATAKWVTTLIPSNTKHSKTEPIWLSSGSQQDVKVSLSTTILGDIPTCHDENLLAKAERALFSTIFWWPTLSNSQLHGSCWPGLGGPNCTAQPQNHSKLFGPGSPQLQTPQQGDNRKSFKPWDLETCGPLSSLTMVGNWRAHFQPSHIFSSKLVLESLGNPLMERNSSSALRYLGISIMVS